MFLVHILFTDDFNDIFLLKNYHIYDSNWKEESKNFHFHKIKLKCLNIYKEPDLNVSKLSWKVSI